MFTPFQGDRPSNLAHTFVLWAPIYPAIWRFLFFFAEKAEKTYLAKKKIVNGWAGYNTRAKFQVLSPKNGVNIAIWMLNKLGGDRHEPACIILLLICIWYDPAHVAGKESYHQCTPSRTCFLGRMRYLYYTDPAEHLVTAGKKIDDLSGVWNL